jgi:DNA-binding CsgD family transcriptional regulator
MPSPLRSSDASELSSDTLPTAPILICLVHIALALGDQERVTKLYPRLLSFHGQHYLFLVDRILGEMATLCEDWKAARMHLTAANAAAQREDLRPELARALLAQADFEVACGGHGSEIRARDMLNLALVLFEELNMTTSIDCVRRRLCILPHQPCRSTLRPLPANLTTREVKVLQLVTSGKSNSKIAKELGITEKTVANHLYHIFNKKVS